MDKKEGEWEGLCRKISDMFGVEANLNGILFLVGVREKGLVLKHFSKEEKLDLINLGCCRLLSIQNYCFYHGADETGWPVWEKNPELKPLTEEIKIQVLKESAVVYFKESDEQ